MAGKRVFGQPVKVIGTLEATDDITAINKDIRTRTGNTGGGDTFSRSFFAGPVGYYYITDPSGNRIGFLGPDGSPASFWVLSGGAPGSEVPGFQLDLATGLLTALNGLAISNPLSSSVDALSFNDGTVDASMRAYLVKSHTQFDFLIDGTIAYSVDTGKITFASDAQLNGNVTVSALTAFTCGAVATFGSTAAFSGVVTFASRVLSTNTTSPANLTSSRNDWNPVGSGTTVPTNIRVSANAGLSITGLIAGASGQRITMCNIGSNALSLSHQSGSSSAGNRFFCPGGAAFSIAANGAVDLWYDTTSAGWRVVSK